MFFEPNIVTVLWDFERNIFNFLGVTFILVIKDYPYIMDHKPPFYLTSKILELKPEKKTSWHQSPETLQKTHSLLP